MTEALRTCKNEEWPVWHREHARYSEESHSSLVHISAGAAPETSLAISLDMSRPWAAYACAGSAQGCGPVPPGIQERSLGHFCPQHRDRSWRSGKVSDGSAIYCQGRSPSPRAA